MLSWSNFVLVIIVILVAIAIFFASLLWFSSKSENREIEKQCGIKMKNGTLRSSVNNDVSYNPNDMEGYPIMITDGYSNQHADIHRSIFQGNLDFLNHFGGGGFLDTSGIGEFSGCDAGGGDCGGGDD